jgi:hypothetical protein
MIPIAAVVHHHSTALNAIPKIFECLCKRLTPIQQFIHLDAIDKSSSRPSSRALVLGFGRRNEVCVFNIAVRRT